MNVTSAPAIMLSLPRRATVALDMAGCPNRCRHCYLGRAQRATLSRDDLRWAVAQFRGYVSPGETQPFFDELKAASWLREPDYAPCYRELYALERGLGDGPPQRFELLSIYRLARDADYAAWAKEIGTVACQVSFFGVGDTQDWFYRRKGAFDDCLVATERMLAHGIAPRWQLFLTRRLLPELDDLLRLVERLQLHTRAEANGQVFQLFLHTPAPDGEARRIEHLRPTLAEAADLPPWLLDASCLYLGRERLWKSEAQWLDELRVSAPSQPFAYGLPRWLAFYVLPDWSVYSNIATLEPWWRLGNLRQDGVHTVMARLLSANTVGLRTVFAGDALCLTEQYGDPQGQRIYDTLNDLLGRYVGAACEANWPSRAGAQASQ